MVNLSSPSPPGTETAQAAATRSARHRRSTTRTSCSPQHSPYYGVMGSASPPHASSLSPQLLNAVGRQSYGGATSRLKQQMQKQGRRASVGGAGGRRKSTVGAGKQANGAGQHSFYGSMAWSDGSDDDEDFDLQGYEFDVASDVSTWAGLLLNSRTSVIALSDDVNQ